jgi:heme exporter protein A
MSPLLSADQLSLERGGRELFSNLTFQINPGDLIQLAGDNGAGKTSLLRILAGLSRYGFDGTVQRLSAQLFLGHLPAVKGLLTPRENLAWHVDGRDTCSDEDIEQALEKVGLYGYEDVPSHNLSAGQHRRVNLARLYLSQCPLWLLDEPFTAIDRSGVASLEALIVDKVNSGGAVILTSHQPLQLDHPLLILDLKKGLGG